MNCFRSLYLWVDLQPINPRVPPSIVVNCFRSLYLWVDLQPVGEEVPSLCVVNCFRSLYLWVDLQQAAVYAKEIFVVNCFRSLYLWVDLQQSFYHNLSLLCCELLSFFVPLGWFTALRTMSIFSSSCELLSFFVPLGWFTAKDLNVTVAIRLWIAFVLCTFGLIYSRKRVLHAQGKVVNCFRSLYLWVDLQLHVSLRKPPACCELLSFFVPLGWFTARHPDCQRDPSLWIAFVLCTFGLIYSSLNILVDGK